MTQKTLGDYSSTGSECPTCGNTYASEKGVKIHHKQVHGESIAGVEVECAWCGDTFRKKQSWAERVDNHFCPGKDCEHKWRSERFTGEGGPAWNGGDVELDCTWCGDDIERKSYRVERSDRHFCNRNCFDEWLESDDCDRSGENSPRWNGGLETVECAVCGTEKEVKAHRVEDYDRHFCRGSCKAEWVSNNFSGDGNPAWNGGHDFYTAMRTLVDDNVWTKAREECRERHNRECAVCGVDERELDRKLDVHHIVPVLSGGTNGQYNLIPLCQECHGPVESYTRDIIKYEFKQHGGKIREA